MKKLCVFEQESYQRIGGSSLSSADKKKIKEISALYDQEIAALQNDLDEFTFFNMGFMLGRKDMELQQLGFESCDTDSDQSAVSQRITECRKSGLRLGLRTAKYVK